MLNITTFTNENFGSVRVAYYNNEPIFCASDLCKILGYNNGRVTIERLFGKGVTKCYTPTNSGNQELTYLTEQQLYKLIMRSNAKNAELFQDWVCGEVLPSLRKSGGYIVNQENLTNDEILANAVLLAQNIIKQKENRINELEQEQKANAHKVLTYDELMNSSDNLDFLAFSKLINIGRTTLFTKLRDLKILMSNNYPYQQYIKNGFFRCIEQTYIKDDKTHLNIKTLITPKGQAYLLKKLKVEQL